MPPKGLKVTAIRLLYLPDEMVVQGLPESGLNCAPATSSTSPDDGQSDQEGKNQHGEFVVTGMLPLSHA